MKKLMTMIAAVATAFGLYAADTDIISGAAFDGTDPTLSKGTLTWSNDVGFVSTFWSNYADVLTLTPGDATEEGKATIGRPKAFTADPMLDHDHYMAVKTTFGNPAFMRVKAGNDKQMIDSGLYFDGLVKFTAFDDTPQAYDGKIAVYLKINEEETETNLFVRAAGPNGTTNDYPVVVSGDIAPDTWYRLTIKAIDDIDVAAGNKVAFMVFVDGTAVNSTDPAVKITSGLKPQYAPWGKDGQLFLSLGGSDNEIEGVGFDGQGAIDDIVFTTEVPFPDAKDPDMITVQWPATVEKVSFDGETWMTITPTNLQLTAASSGVLYWKGAGDYMDGQTNFTGLASGGTLEILSGDVKSAGAKFNTLKFATVADAVDYANTNGTAGTVKLLANATAALSFEKENTVLDLGGWVLTQPSGEAAAIKIVTGTTLTITNTVDGGKVAGNGDAELAFAVDAWDAPVTINGGTFDALVAGAKENLIINNGKFAGETAPNATIPDGKKWSDAKVDNYWVLVEDTSVEVSFANGTNCTVTKVNGVDYTAGTPIKLELGDATVTYTAAANYQYGNGEEATTTKDVAITVSEAGSIAAPAEAEPALIVAEIDTAKYTSLQAAAAEAGDGETIVLAADYTGNGTLMEFNLSTPAKRNVTLDINGKKVAKNDSDSAYAFSVYGEGTLTVIDSVTDSQGYLGKDDVNGSCFLVGGCGDQYKGKGGRPAVATAGHLVWNSGKAYCKSSNVIKIEYGTLEVNGGTIDGNQPASGKTTVAIKASVAESSGGSTATIKGGLILGSVEQSGTGAKVEIPALVNEALNPAKFTADYTSFIDPTTGYEMKQGEGNYWTVQEKQSTPTIVPGGTPAQVTAESATEAESKVIVSATSPDSEVISDADYAKYFKAQATLVEGNTYNVSVVLDPAKVDLPTTEAAFDAEIGDFAADTEATGITVTNAKPGLFYYVEEANKLESGLAEAARDRAMAGKTGSVTVPMTKFSGSGFYQLKVSNSQRGVVTGQ